MIYNDLHKLSEKYLSPVKKATNDNDIKEITY